MKKNKGQTLVEMVVAVGMVSLVLVAVVAGIAISVRNSRFSKNKALATRYAQEGIERFRIYRDEYGWEPFYREITDYPNNRSSVTYCLDDFPSGLDDEEGWSDSLGSCTSETIGNEGVYTRYADVTIQNITPPNYIDVAMTVGWFEGAAPHTVVLTTRFNERTNK